MDEGLVRSGRAEALLQMLTDQSLQIARLLREVDELQRDARELQSENADLSQELERARVELEESAT